MSDSKHFYRSQPAATRSEIWRNRKFETRTLNCVLKICRFSRGLGMKIRLVTRNGFGTATLIFSETVVFSLRETTRR